MTTPDYIVDGTLTDGEAWVQLESTTVAGSAASITWQTATTGVDNWAQYMDLFIVAYGRGSGSATAQQVYMHFNNVTSGGFYYGQDFEASGGTASAHHYAAASQMLLGHFPAATGLANAFGSTIAECYNMNSGNWIPVMAVNAGDRSPGSAAGAGYAELQASMWGSYMPIQRIDLHAISDTFEVGSRFDLYGILPRMVTA